MKKLLLLFSTFIIIFQIFMCCSTSKAAEFTEFYSQVTGFSENDEKEKTIPEDAILMMTNGDFQRFKDKYFTPREIPLDTPNKEKAVLFLQIPSQTSSVDSYSVDSIKINNDTLTVNLKKSGVYEVDGIEGFNGVWKLVMLIEIDKTNLKENMKIVVNK